jgi:hypothetical protein
VSHDDKLDLARGWRSAMKLREEEADRLAGLKDEEFAEAMADLPAPERVPTIDEIVSRARDASPDAPQAKAGVQAIGTANRPKPSPVVWLLAAAAILLAILATKKDQIVALFEGPPKPVPQQPTPSPPQPSPRELAATPRGDAQKACAAGDWGTCADKLDEAAKLDPAGETSPDVRQMRELIRDGRQRDFELEAKPKRKP